ncbi:efflux RND transporter permease subunit [Rhodobacteraceae bacterium CCMM004]|nr:efflux RND transporter permease subunit [Rhodobacteraceae bacterium CCMM004]
MARQLSAAGGILSYFTRHRTAANLLLVVMLALGLAAAPQMRAQFFPDVILDDVTVSVRWDGAGAEDVDTAIVGVLEPALLAVEGVVASEARSTEGRATLTVEFEPGWDMARAADDVAAAVDAIAGLPNEAEDPEIRRSTWWDRVTDVVITGPVGVDQLGRFADEFSARLFQAGVTRVTIRGVAAPETVVEVPALSLLRHDLTMSEIAEAIAEEAEADPAGDVGGAARVRTGVAKRSAEDIAAIVLRSEGDGSKLTIGDVAEVRVEGIDRERSYFVGPNPAVSIRVDRSDRGDAIGIQRTVEEVAAEMELGLPEGVHIDLIRTRAEAITGRIGILLDNGLVGLGLVVALLFLFLNARTAFWVAAGIPVAMTAAIALMWAAGLTLNMISLFALIITLGIVVDDAIVVGEHADFRARHLGEPPVVAAENAARRMFPAVLSATITTIIAFFGLVAIGGRFGDLIADIPFTVIVVLAASLVECFLILPNHMAHSIAHSAKVHWYDLPSRVVDRGFTWVRDTLFRRLMAAVVWARYPVMAGTLLVLASQATLFIRGDVQWRFFNAPEQGSVSGNFAMQAGATREDTLEMMRILQQAVDDLGAKYEAEHGRNPVAYALAEIGGTTGRGLSGTENTDAALLGSIAIELIDADLRPYSSFAFVAELQDAVPRHPRLETISFRGWRSGPGGDALDVQISGATSETLKAAAENLKGTLAQFPEVSALEDSLAYDKEELILELTPQGQALGLSIDGLGRVLRDRLNGIEAASFPDGPRSASIRVELPPDELTADFLDRTMLRTPAGAYVNLVDVVTVETRRGFSTIRRENGLRLISVTGDLSEDDPARAQEIMAALEETILPTLEEDFGVATAMSGLAEQESDFLNDALIGFTLCLLGIYLTLAWIFASWTRPIVVMAIIPFGLVGTIYGHHLWDVPLSMFTVVGLIGMTGIIINDSIVLVTTVDEYAEERGLIPAIVDGASDRLRPVLLTTLTTVLGLAPLLYETSSQAQFLKPTVITLVYGLGFGMVLVLLVVPALMAMQQDVGKQLRGLRRALLGGRHRAAAVAAGAGALGVVTAFAATLGAVIVQGQVWAPVAAALPLAEIGMMVALGLFLGLSALWLIGIWLLANLLFALRRRPA